jgi:hypothetical protein
MIRGRRLGVPTWRSADTWRSTGNGSARRAPAPRSRTSGQSVTEFALVIPILLLILLTVADFGRYFAASIQVESMSRTAAEVAAQEYVREVAAAPSDPRDYDLIHSLAWQSVCDEGRDLPNASPGSGGGECSDLPTRVCVHDGLDAICGSVYNEGSGVAAECTAVAGAPPTAALDSQGHAYVEVTVCYRFSSVLQLTIPFLGISLTPLSGNFFIERTRHFTAADY